MLIPILQMKRTQKIANCDLVPITKLVTLVPLQGLLFLWGTLSTQREHKLLTGFCSAKLTRKTVVIGSITLSSQMANSESLREWMSYVFCPWG